MSTLTKNEDSKLTAAQRGNGYPVERMERRPAVAPPVDIHENADEILVVADVPGAHPDGVTVRLEKNELFLHASRAEERPGQALLGGQPSPDYARTFVVPRGIDAERITAEMNSGVLRIRLPKSEAVKPRRIQVKSA